MGTEPCPDPFPGGRGHPLPTVHCASGASNFTPLALVHPSPLHKILNRPTPLALASRVCLVTVDSGLRGLGVLDYMKSLLIEREG